LAFTFTHPIPINKPIIEEQPGPPLIHNNVGSLIGLDLLSKNQKKKFFPFGNSKYPDI
jgi:hypothetical protein